MTGRRAPAALPTEVLDMAVRWLRSPDAPDPAVVCYACGLSSEQLMEACGERGHDMTITDNGMEGYYYQHWWACIWCNAIDDDPLDDF